MTETDHILPALAPSDDEVVLPADPSFESECMAAISDSAKELKWQFKNSILTRSEKWGLVWRVDFETPGVSASTGFINRVACWRLPEEGSALGLLIAHGQRVSPL